MSSSNKTVIAFDLYGTLLSIESIAKDLAKHFGNEKASSIASLWRRYVSNLQISSSKHAENIIAIRYTWRMNSMSLYKPSSEITHTSFRHALDEHSLSLSTPDIEDLMKAYNSLGTFPDFVRGLKALASDPSTTAYLFSNGTDSMVSSSVKKSQELSPHASVFKDIIPVEEVKAYKPDMKVYQHLAEKVGKSNGKEDMQSIWLVSGNPFDVVGAREAGIRAAWIDRGGEGWTDKLGKLASGGPDVVGRGVEEVVKAIQGRVRGGSV